MSVPRGLFISFEGSEGCGKSTQIRRLSARLKTLGIEVTLTREPGGTAIGEEIRHLLQYSSINAAMTAETELLLFTASRAQLVRELIEPALAESRIVIADRFLDSTTVYQGVARRLSPDNVRFINEFAVGALRPAITFLLDLSPELARERMLNRPPPAAHPDRMEQEPSEFYEAVRAGYLQVAAAEPERIRVIDASQPEDAVESDIWRAVEPHLGPALPAPFTHGLLA